MLCNVYTATQFLFFRFSLVLYFSWAHTVTFHHQNIGYKTANSVHFSAMEFIYSNTVLVFSVNLVLVFLEYYLEFDHQLSSCFCTSLEPLCTHFLVELVPLRCELCLTLTSRQVMILQCPGSLRFSDLWMSSSHSWIPAHMLHCCEGLCRSLAWPHTNAAVEDAADWWQPTLHLPCHECRLWCWWSGTLKTAPGSLLLSHHQAEVLGISGWRISDPLMLLSSVWKDPQEWHVVAMGLSVAAFSGDMCM